MSKRLYVQTKHEIEYGDSNFNYQNEEVYDVLSVLGCEVCDHDMDGYGDEIELDRSEVEDARKQLAEYAERVSDAKDGDDIEDGDDSDICDALDELYKDGYDGYSPKAKAEMFIEVLDEWLRESPQDKNWIWLSWF